MITIILQVMPPQCYYQGTGTPRGASRHHPKGTGGKVIKHKLQALQHHIKVPVFLTTPAIPPVAAAVPKSEELVEDGYAAF